MLLDDGICTIYSVEQDESSKTPTRKLTPKTQAWYKELSFGVTEYYKAEQAAAKVEKRARILQDKTVSSQDMIKLCSGPVLKIGRVFHGTDEAGNLITDLTLEKTALRFEIEEGGAAGG